MSALAVREPWIDKIAMIAADAGDYDWRAFLDHAA